MIIYTGVIMWSDITARHLLALQAVHEEGTFGRAGERLGFTQSAISQQVASLETIVGQPLFDRQPGPRPPTLTPAGELVLVHAETLLSNIQQAERELDNLVRGVSGSLRVGTFQSISARVLPIALGQMYKQAPNVEIILVDDELTDNVHDAVLSGDLDIAFSMDTLPDVELLSLASDPYVALVQHDEPAGPIQLHGLKSRPLVGPPETNSCGRAIGRRFERLGITPNYAFRSHDNGAVQAMVAAGVGMAIVPLLTVDTADPRISIRRIEPEIEPREISVIWDDRRTLPPLAHQLITLLSNVCNEQLSQTVAT